MLTNIYNQTVTILNRLKRTDSSTNTDVWYKTILTDAAWYTSVEKSVDSSGVYIGTSVTVLLPFHDDYIPYSEWKELGVQDSCFTMSTGDYIVLGVVDEDITAQNIVKVMESYGGKKCVVKHHQENYDRFGARVQIKIEGV